MNLAGVSSNPLAKVKGPIALAFTSGKVFPLGAQNGRYPEGREGGGKATGSANTYGADMVNLFGYLWAMGLKDYRTPKQQKQDGLPEHATMTETSCILALQPQAVAPDYKAAPPYAGKSIRELEQIASREDWPGYFGAPSLASAELGKKMYDQWVQHGTELVNRVLNGEGSVPDRSPDKTLSRHVDELCNVTPLPTLWFTHG